VNDVWLWWKQLMLNMQKINSPPNFVFVNVTFAALVRCSLLIPEQLLAMRFVSVRNSWRRLAYTNVSEMPSPSLGIIWTGSRSYVRPVKYDCAAVEGPVATFRCDPHVCELQHCLWNPQRTLAFVSQSLLYIASIKVQ